jgi:uncharacterized DUF497 family protein
MIFEWNEDKNRENIEKHNVSFEEAQEVFRDLKLILLLDKKHSLQESRFFAIGKAKNGIMTVRFTIRNNIIRIFGAGYWRKQQKYYETENNLH